MYKNCIKRVIDIILSLTGLILASWLYLIIIIAIKIDDPGPVLFKQKRVGKGKTYFQLVKFRSMKMSTPHDCPTHLLADPDQYITRVGRFLRKTSLDENVIIGQSPETLVKSMVSLVCPIRERGGVFVPCAA